MQEQAVTLAAGERMLDAYLAVPDDGGRRSAIVVIHEIRGLDDHIKDVARRFAGQGYVALAPDLYTGPWRDTMRPDRIMGAGARGFMPDNGTCRILEHL